MADGAEAQPAKAQSAGTQRSRAHSRSACTGSRINTDNGRVCSSA
jgi:hypothetical protein